MNVIYSNRFHVGWIIGGGFGCGRRSSGYEDEHSGVEGGKRGAVAN